MFAWFMFFLVVAIFAFAVYSNSKDENPSQSSQSAPSVPSRPAPTPTEEYERREFMRQAYEAFDDATYLALYRHEYTGELPHRIAGNFYDNMYPDVYTFSIAGINKRRGIKKYGGTYFHCQLIPDPKNPYDKNAIKVVHEDGTHLGFIPADETDIVREFVANQFPVRCYAHIEEKEDYDDFNENGEPRTYLYGHGAFAKNGSQPASILTSQPLPY